MGGAEILFWTTAPAVAALLGPWPLPKAHRDLLRWGVRLSWWMMNAGLGAIILAVVP